jgi:lysophospholipase L1-like esterase
MLIVGILFLAIEGTVRLFWPQTTRTDYFGGASLAIPDDRMGHRLRPYARAEVVGPEFAVDYRIDAHGLRDQADHPLPKPEGTTRILVLGDSFAFGSGNAYQESWPALLEDRLAADGYRVDVVKAGVPGYDTRTEALYLESVFADFDPDLVLLTFLPNDLFTNRPIDSAGRNLDGEEFPVVARGDKRSNLHSLILLKRLLMANDSIYVRLYALTQRLEYFLDPPTPTLRRQIEVTEALLERVQEFCQQRDRDLVVLSIPQQFQVLAPEQDDRLGVDVHAIDRIFGEVADGRGFAWLAALPSLRKVYRAGAGDLYFRFDGHLNRLGNAALTDYLASALGTHLRERLQRREMARPGPV